MFWYTRKATVRSEAHVLLLQRPGPRAHRLRLTIPLWKEVDILRILGIDPGLAIVGYGVLDQDPAGRLSLVDFGTILTYPKDTVPVRLRQLANGMRQIIQQFQPDAIAFEELFFKKNVTTGINVAQARGAVIVSAAEYTDELYEYTPLQVKQAITGYGGADKRQVQLMVCSLLKLKSIPRPDDAADAVAVALCHAHSAGRLRRDDAKIQ